MKTSRAFIVGGTAAAILTTGWAVSPKATEAALSASASTSSATSSSGSATGAAGTAGDSGSTGSSGTSTEDSTDTSTEEPSTEASATSDATAGTSGTFTGESVRTRYGSFSVQITTVDGVVTDVAMVESGDSDHESRQINAYALPTLMQEVLDTQSSDVSYISGASYTSDGFAQSVADAFAQAGLS